MPEATLRWSAGIKPMYVSTSFPLKVSRVQVGPKAAPVAAFGSKYSLLHFRAIGDQDGLVCGLGIRTAAVSPAPGKDAAQCHLVKI